MSAKQKYWLVQARAGTVLFIGFAAMWLICSQGNNIAGYAVGAIALVLAALTFVRVDRKNAQKLDSHS